MAFEGLSEKLSARQDSAELEALALRVRDTAAALLEE